MGGSAAHDAVVTPEDRDDAVIEPTEQDEVGRALDEEIAADRRRGTEARRRWLLYVPPILSLCIAAAAIALSRPREVNGARILAGGLPPPATPLALRAVVVRANPELESASPVFGMELRVVSAAAARATTTDAEGVSEIVVDPPIPAKMELEGHLPGKPFVRLATIVLAALAPPDPRDGVVQAKRGAGTPTGELVIDCAPEGSALSPPIRGSAWIRVRRGGMPVEGARVETTIEAGAAGVIPAVVTDAAGLARIDLVPTAPPVILALKATKDGAIGSWIGVLGSVLGVPVPSGDGFVDVSAKAVDLLAPSTRTTGYWDLWKGGVRVGGGALAFQASLLDGRGAHGTATIPLPRGASGVYDLEVTSSPYPAPREDLAHAVAYPIVVATDPVDAFGAIATSPRFDDRVSPPGGSLTAYRGVVAASIARAPSATPARVTVADGLAVALRHETERGKKVRRASTFAILGGGLVELSLMILLGVLRNPARADDELRALDGLAPNPTHRKDPTGRRLFALALAAVGIVALLFAGMAIMAWGMP